MHYNLSIAFILASFTIILSAFNVLSSFMYFIIAGQIPGTSIILPANALLIGYCISLIVLSVYSTYTWRHAVKKRVTVSKKAAQPLRRRQALGR